MTVNVQLPDFCAASTAVHETFVVPWPNVEPDAGVQAGGAMGARPPVTVGALNVTAKGIPSIDNCETAAGHVKIGGPVLTGVGDAGVSPQPAVTTKHVATSKTEWDLRSVRRLKSRIASQ